MEEEREIDCIIEELHNDMMEALKTRGKTPRKHETMLEGLVSFFGPEKWNEMQERAIDEMVKKGVLERE